MKQVLYSLIVFAVLFTACKKEAAVTPSKPAVYSEPDFALIPTKNAKWHIKGIISNNDYFSPGFAWDLGYEASHDSLKKYEIIIESTSRDTVVNKQQYHIYRVARLYCYNSGDVISKSMYNVYLREDTLAQKVMSIYGYTVMDFSDEYNVGEIVPFYSWREVNITRPDSILLAGYYFKRWNMQNIYDGSILHFYKAKGIGTFYGLLFDVRYSQSLEQVTSLDFYYKGDSIHFDYPLQ